MHADSRVQKNIVKWRCKAWKRIVHLNFMRKNIKNELQTHLVSSSGENSFRFTKTQLSSSASTVKSHCFVYRRFNRLSPEETPSSLTLSDMLFSQYIFMYSFITVYNCADLRHNMHASVSGFTTKHKNRGIEGPRRNQ